MSKRIYAALPEEFIRRMRNWARSSSGTLKVAGLISSCYQRERIVGDQWTSGFYDDQYVILHGDALDVDAALADVPSRYRAAVQLFWWWEGCATRALARRLEVDYHTAEAWVIRGHELLRAAMVVRREASIHYARRASESSLTCG
jgi:DNA-directed RNA polymerase specialized sigma24 family protein